MCLISGLVADSTRGAGLNTTAGIHIVHTAGFVAGPRADKLSRMQPEDAVSRFLQQLDNVFGSTADPTPATASYVKAHVFDWSNEPWVGGAYTFPCHGVEAGDREALAAPVNDTLFFAGEERAAYSHNTPMFPLSLLSVYTHTHLSPHTHTLVTCCRGGHGRISQPLHAGRA